jgi:hypothetical protein
MAQTNYAVVIDDAYVVPDGALTKEQYVNFVMNRAAESYQRQYNTATVDDGIGAACDAYNAALLPVSPAE